MNKYRVIGIMSGTSLDGIDLAHCELEKRSDKWCYTISATETLPYTKEWKNMLAKAHLLSGLELSLLHVNYGKLLGTALNEFIIKNKLKVDLVSSHGHTIFHQPQKALTLQIGSGAEIAAACGLPVVCDFRSVDVALGGQGAPLVPIGDKLLFSEYDYCLNLGGIANISYDDNGSRKAFDICPVNIAANMLAAEKGMAFDTAGKFGKDGTINKDLLNNLNALSFYNDSGKAKSLGREWIEQNFLPILFASTACVEDKLCTLYHHIAQQITLAIKNKKSGKMLITGGGAYNSFLIDTIIKYSSWKIEVPDKTTIEFKEALIFALLGLFRYNNEVNCLSSVTGAAFNNIGGCIYRSV